MLVLTSGSARRQHINHIECFVNVNLTIFQSDTPKVRRVVGVKRITNTIVIASEDINFKRNLYFMAELSQHKQLLQSVFKNSRH